MGRWFRTAAAAAVSTAAGAVSAQSTLPATSPSAFPSKPVHIFVPYPAGGGVDVLTRTLGEVVSKQWGQSVVVENRPGAGGLIASQAVATVAARRLYADHGGKRSCHQSVPVPQNSLRHLQGFHADLAAGLVPQYPAGADQFTVQDGGRNHTAARAKPGSLSFAHAGNGTSTHLAGELLKNLAKIDLNAIPYKGGAPAINDLLGGQIPMSFNNGPESVGQLQAGTLRALAVTTADRAPFLPDVPSMSEAVPGYDTGVWWGLLGPAGMPPDVLAKLSQDFVAALNTDAVKERLTKLGASPIGSTPQQFDAKIHADYEKWGPIIKAAGMTAE